MSTNTANLTINHYFASSPTQPSHLEALKFKQNNRWQSLSWSEYYKRSEALAHGLQKLGLNDGDRVALICNTRMEWPICDRAIQGLHLVTVPIYPSSNCNDIMYILENSEAKVLICENQEHLDRWLEVADKCPQVVQVVVIDKVNTTAKNVMQLEELMAGGEDLVHSDKDFFKNKLNATTLDQVATIIYTSGTTGVPKGVVLTHLQVMSEVHDIFDLVSVNDKDTSLSFLPYAHILGRVESWGSIYAKYTLAFAECIEQIRSNITEVSPTFIIGVPRIFEKIYNGVLTQAEASPAKSKIFNWAISIGKKVSHLRISKKTLPIMLLTKYLTAKQLVFDKIHQKLGGKMRFAVSGGAPLSGEIASFFHAAGLLILEGYGLTETTAGVTFNSPEAYSFGTVGRPFGDVKVKLAEDGEILIKSDKVMKEYYKNPNATQEVFIDGYFATGDIGEWTDDGFLKITDRKKDLIKTAGGKYVAPQRLENLLKLNKYVSNVLIHGDRKKYIVALITLDPDNIEEFAKSKQISFANIANLAQTQEVKDLMQQVVAETNTHLASYESIKKFHVLDHDFTIETGELTPSLKVKRKHCDKKYEETINDLYGVDRSSL